MPQRALPIAPVPMVASLTPFRREYRDLLKRPMMGTLTITATGEAIREGEAAVLPAQVKATLVAGELFLELPPGTYVIEGDLWTVDDSSVHEVETVTVEG